ncbi:MAG: hypothetical protein ACLGIK_16800, partial [Gemmatimonadota bacterium]
MRLFALLLFGFPATLPVSSHQREGPRAPPLRVVVGSAPYEAAPGAHGEWEVRDAWGRAHARGNGTPDWTVERRNLRTRVVFAGGARATAWSDAPFVLVPVSSSGAVAWHGRRYRGTLAFVAVDTATGVLGPAEEQKLLASGVALVPPGEESLDMLQTGD